MRYAAIVVVLVANVALADSFSISEFGIDSKSTGLDGTGVEIGQVEPGRSAKAGYDAAAASASNTKPAGVYFQGVGGMDPPGGHITDHATRVAGVMIGDASAGAMFEGVAPKANLHSSGFSGDLVDATLALNRMATLSGAGIDVKAMNMSFGTEPDGIVEDVDGRSLLTQFIDWSARRHDVLYVVGWPNSDLAPKFLPSDEYNGITVAASGPTELLFDEEFTRFGEVNNPDIAGGDAIGDRTSIDILAPGTAIFALNPGDVEVEVSGSSEAVAHVTGTVALLQQSAQQQIDASNPRFSGGINPNSQRHETMKAVMMNAADKIDGVHGSGRTIKDSSDKDWTMSEAFNNAFIPLDDEMGAGHLNARRSVQQLSPGEYGAGMVPKIGWDYGSIGDGGTVEYMLSGVSGYIAITLAWDRVVNHTESCGAGTYCSGDQFFPYADTDDILNNLNVSLKTDLGITVAESISQEMNLEHIFFNVQNPGDYRIVVEHIGGLGTSQNYALAWWNGDAATPVPGDYNKNGSVGPEDYDVWKSNFGTTFADADGNGNGTVDAADYTIWRDNLGAGSGSGSLAAVPEPSAAWLMMVGLVGLMGARRGRNT